VRRIASDYAYDFPSLAPFFAGDPASPAAWTDAIARVAKGTRPTGEIAAIVAAQQTRRGAPPAATEAARRLTDDRTVAVLTGQQAGLFGGPLFTLLKAVTALQLAERITREHGVPAVAVFWIEAEDHDWDEVRSSTVFDETLTPRTVALPPASDDRLRPVGSIRLDAAINEVLDGLEAALPPTEFRGELLTSLRECYAPAYGMADAFGRWLERTLGGRGLVVYDAGDAAGKPLVSEVFAREVSGAGETSRLAARAGSDLVARGYHAQVQVSDDSLALFHVEDGRRPIRRDGTGFLAGDRSFTSSALAQAARTEPQRFSPGVLLRPLVQDTLFPTVCYVAGPNELAYLAQLRGVYEHFGVPMPLVYPRASATILDAAALRFLTRYAVPLDTLQPQDEAGLNELLKAQIPPSVEESFARAAEAIESQMRHLAEALPALDPTLEGAARSTLGRMQHDLQTLHGKMIQAAKRRDETLRRQYLRTRALAFPNGHAQERTVGFVSFLNQYGPALVERLSDELPLELGKHWVVSI
jgi:bacillithiol biosynthesis cysteine-adding enzyme BshC